MLASVAARPSPRPRGLPPGVVALVIAAALTLALPGGRGVATAGPAGTEGALANPQCPVMTGKAARAEHSVVYRGRRIFFCCESCVDTFRADPEVYLKNLPPAPAGATAAVTAEGAAAGPPPRRPGALMTILAELRDLHWVAALVVLGWLLVRQRVGRRRPGSLELPATGGAASRWGARIVTPAALGAALLIAELGPQVWRMRELHAQDIGPRVELRAQAAELERLKDIEEVHYATFYDYGTPPRPRRMAGPKKLASTYYRGNDERDDELWNRGHYLTATLDVSIRTDDKPAVQPGDQVGGKHPALRVRITRGPHTPDFFWTRPRMSRHYLTRQSDPFMGRHTPVPDRVPLDEREPARRWEAAYPLDVPAKGKAELHTIVYLCEEQYREGELLGGRFHYAIELDLYFEDGKILPSSDLWMNSTYRGRKFAAYQITEEEWLSEKPIPAKPAAGTTNEKALGIDDYKPPGAL